jgi:hypothetical protein
MNHPKLSHPSSLGHRPDRLSHPTLPVGRIGQAEKPSDHPAGGFSRTLRSLLLPLAVTALTGLASVTGLTAFAGSSPDPAALIPALSALTLTLASLAGGVTAGLCRREQALSGSLISGCILAALLCLSALAGGSGETEGVWSAYSPAVPWLIRIAPIPLHGLGGFLTRQRQKKPAHTAGKHSVSR